MAIPAGVALAVVAVVALVLLVNPATTQALGIKGPGRAQDGKRIPQKVLARQSV